MKTIVPTQPNYSITSSDDVVKIITQATKTDSLTMFLFGLTGSFSFVMTILFYFLITAAIKMYVFGFAWFLFLLWLGLIVALGFLVIWQIKFREMVSVSNESITVEYQAPFFKRSYQYLAKHVQNLRLSVLPRSILWQRGIAFDYGGQTLYIGSRLNKSEAKQILETMQKKFANYDYDK